MFRVKINVFIAIFALDSCFFAFSMREVEDSSGFRIGKMVHFLCFYVPFLLLLPLLTVTCSRSSENGDYSHFRSGGDNNRISVRMVVLHSYDDVLQEGEYFRNYMSEHLRKYHKNISAEIHHIYLDLVHVEDPAVALFGGYGHFVDSVCGFSPDVLLINDDLALEYVFEHFDTLLHRQPVVFAGVSAPRPWQREEYPFLTGWEDPVDLASNCEILRSVTGLHNVTVELDHSAFDDRLRRQIYDNISDSTRFINNGDYHLLRLEEDVLNTPQYAGKIVVNFMSMSDRTSNMRHDADDFGLTDEIALDPMYDSLLWIMQIQVKYDIFSNEKIDTEKKPRLTAIRERFNVEGRQYESTIRSDVGYTGPQFLGGYFASVETQIQDQLHYAISIMEGSNPQFMPVISHQKGYYLDWHAMSALEPRLSYRDYHMLYNIVNVPFRVSHRLLFIIIVTLLSALAAAVPTVLAVRIIRKMRGDLKKLDQDIGIESVKMRLSTDNRELLLFRIHDGKISFIKDMYQDILRSPYSWSTGSFAERVDSDSLPSYRIITGLGRNDGESGRVRLLMNVIDETKHWWDVFYISNPKGDGTVNGIGVNIDDIVENEHYVQNSMERADEVAAKQNFIANITHDIRTPLNAISGFAQLLAEGCDEEERVLYSNIIMTNTEQLLNLIDSAVNRPTDSTDGLSFKIRSIDISALADDSYRTNRILTPTHLKFHYEPWDGKGVMVDADSVRTSQVINNLVSNAFKYTPKGSVTLGWKVLPGEGQVEVYVEDTGVGISEEDSKHIMDRYSMAKGNKRGTGLGLDICAKIIAAQKGTYGFTSRLGEGSRFWFRLPLSSAAKKATRP